MFDTPPPEITSELRGKHLPLELIENILSRLPVKSLKRFRAVKKSWCYLIDSEKFAKTHMKRSVDSISNRNLVSGLLGFHWMSVDSLDKKRPIKLEFEYNYENIFSISNSCNGLVVVMREPEPPVLLNPFSREYKVLPKCPFDFVADSSFSCNTTYGFGYDSKNDDYKVIKAMLYKKPPSFVTSEEWIYSLKSNSWRRTNGTRYGRGNWPAHVNGALHSIVQTGTARKQVRGLSVETEKDYEVATPDEIDMKGLSYGSLDVLDGCLAFVCNYPSHVVIWVMKEYGVKESWTPLVSYPVGKDHLVRPLAYTKEGDKVVLNCHGKWLALCGVGRRKSVEKVKMPDMFWPRFCVETLISPNGWAVEKRLTQEQSNNQDKKKEVKKNKKRDDFLSKGFKLVL